MPLNLKILPQLKEGMNCSNDVLQLEHDEVLFEMIIQLEREEGKYLEKAVLSLIGNDSAFVPYHYGRTLISGYGDVIREVEAIKLKLIISDYKATTWRNRAALAYIKQLPDNLKIWIYWH